MGETASSSTGRHGRRVATVAVRVVAAAALVASAVGVAVVSFAAPAGAATPTTIAVGNTPVGVRVAPDGAKAYVANFISNTVSVINTGTGTVSSSIGVGTNPFGVALAPNGARLYVMNNSAASVSVINPATNGVVATIAVGQSPRHLAISANSARGYLTNNGSGTVSFLDLTNNTVTGSRFIGAGPAGLDLTPDGSRAYVALQGDAAVVVIDTATNALVTTVTGVGNATGLALTPDGTKAYVSDNAGGNVSVISTATNTKTKTIAVGGNPYEIAVTPDGSRAYVVDSAGNALKAIDTSTDTVVGSVGVGSGPTDVAVAPDGSAVYVTNTGSHTVTVLRAPSITSPASTSFPVGQAGTFTATATGAPTAALAASGGVPAWLTVIGNGDGTATLSGTPPTGSAGTYQFVLTASNALNQHAQTFTLTVSKLDQAITFTSSPPANAAVGATYDVAATGDGSGNPVVVSVTTPAVCSISGLHVNFTGAGTCTINADQAGNADYHVAPTVSQSVSVAKGTQTIAFTSTPPANVAVGGTYDVAATGGASGNAVTFSVTTPSVCSLSGGAHVSFDAAGTCTVNADQTGNDSYHAAPTVSQSVSVAAGAQTILFTTTPPANATVGGSYDVAATGGPSSSPVVFSISPSSSSVCSISGAHVTFTGAGSCLINADQGGDANYGAAPTATQSVSVAKGTQTITFTSTPPANATVGGSYDLSATGGLSGSPVVFSVTTPSVCSVAGAHVSFVAGGVCTINADQTGDANYNPAPTATQSVSVAKGTQTITFTSTPPANAAVGGTYDVAATGGPSGNPVVFSIAPSSSSVCSISGGAHVTFTATGTCVINADQAGNDSYNAAPTAFQTVRVGTGALATWLKTFPAVRHPGKAPNAVAMRARLTSTTPDKVAIAGVTLTFTLGQGTCTATTNSEGFAGCSVEFAWSAMIPSAYTVSFAGTDVFAENAADGPVVPSAQQP